jgi:hypothetical protein
LRLRSLSSTTNIRFGTASPGATRVLSARFRHFYGDWQITPEADPTRGDPAPERSAQTIALEALGWVLTDQPRAERLLALTGLTPEALRHGLGDRAVLAAVLEFLAGHEADLVAAAVALDLPPERIAAAARELAR